MVERLSDKLAAVREEFTRMALQSVQDTMNNSAQLLKDSGILDNAKHVGDRAPDFVLKNVQGVPVDSTKLRKAKRLVICFYRGGW
ncbi:redoxin domain-containing protein [Halodesulfovibrio marinisediminis]|nr:redoxin domain-containing protein [Halodesulfovibrio marinisediminis]